MRTAHESRLAATSSARGLSATAAEKIVEEDESYMAHRRAQYDAVRGTQQAWGAYEAARLTAQLAVNTAAVA